MNISTFFLRAKHWKVFLVVVILFYAGQISLIVAEVTPQPSQDTISKSLFLGLLTALSITGYFAWLWSLGSFLSSISRPELRMRLGFFRFALIYPFPYAIAFIYVATFQNAVTMSPAFILPPHLLGMICMFYLLYFVSRTLKQAETNEPAQFKNYWLEFFLLWFFPIGIWIIQPRVNRLYAERSSAIL